jgi:secreted trypsin-like serine protease
MSLRRVLLVPVAAVALLLAFVGPVRAVVGGTPSAANANPFMASVQSNGSHFCGGSVIAAQWVLTAAHCVPDGSAAGLSVVTGTNNNLALTDGVRTVVDHVYVHPGYTNNHHDAALLHLANGVAAPPITLAGAADDALETPGAPVTVAGWGDWNPVTLGLTALPLMMETQLNVVSDTDCAAANAGFDAPTGVCAAALLKDSCQGDSGGPLFAKVGTKRIQVGIVSYGFFCAIPTFPGVYSEVNNSDIRSWISATAGV